MAADTSKDLPYGSDTIRLNQNFATDSSGLNYELRYNTKDGSTVLVGYKPKSVSTGRGAQRTTTYEEVVVYTSTPGTKGTITNEGSTLITSGLKVSGSEENATSDTLISEIASKSNAAYEVKNAEYNSKKTPPKRRGAAPSATPSNVGDPPVKPDIDAPVVPPKKIDDEKSKGNNEFDLLGKADAVLEGIINKIENDVLKGEIKLDDFTLKPLDLEFSKDTAIRGIFQYPLDAIYKYSELTQDYMQIVQYSYKPPYKDNIFKSGAVDILTKGSKRTSPFEEFIGMVKLPMPNNISDSNSVNWGEDQMNDLNTAILNSFASDSRSVLKAAAVGGAASALGLGGAGRLATFLALLGNAGGLDGLKNVINNKTSGGLIQSAVSSRVLALAGIQVSPESILARGAGVVPNSNMELLFNSPTLRSFQFSWKLSPRDEKEALMVNKIVRFFKQGMAVKKLSGKSGSGVAGGQSLFLGTPNIFKLNFKTQNGSDISGVNKIKACAIKSCSVNYTPEQIWASYKRGQPVSIQISLTVQELEPIYDTDYQEVTDEKRLFTSTEDSANTGDLDSIRGKDPVNDTVYDVGY